MIMRIDLAGWALLLITVGIAYLICLKANKEEGKLFKYGGYVIGVFILIAALVLAVSGLRSRARRRKPASRTAIPTGSTTTQRRRMPRSLKSLRRKALKASKSKGTATPAPKVPKAPVIPRLPEVAPIPKIPEVPAASQPAE